MWTSYLITRHVDLFFVKNIYQLAQYMYTHIVIFDSKIWWIMNPTKYDVRIMFCVYLYKTRMCITLYFIDIVLLTAGFDIYLWRVLYYTDWGSVGHVGKVALDGSYRVVLTTAENPNDLIISDNKLLIINNKQPSAEIIEIDLANSNSAISRRQLSSVVSWLGPWIESNNHVLFYGFQ